MKKTNASAKSNELIDAINAGLEFKVNLARVKLIAHIVMALCKVRTVTFNNLANSFETSTDSKSSLRRIQRFMTS